MAKKPQQEVPGGGVVQEDAPAPEAPVEEGTPEVEDAPSAPSDIGYLITWT